MNRRFLTSAVAIHAGACLIAIVSVSAGAPVVGGLMNPSGNEAAPFPDPSRVEGFADSEEPQVQEPARAFSHDGVFALVVGEDTVQSSGGESGDELKIQESEHQAFEIDEVFGVSTASH